jgi:cell division protein FtsB
MRPVDAFLAASPFIALFLTVLCTALLALVWLLSRDCAGLEDDYTRLSKTNTELAAENTRLTAANEQIATDAEERDAWLTACWQWMTADLREQPTNSDLEM